MTFLGWLIFCDSHSPAFLDLFISFDSNICSAMAFHPLQNSDHVVGSVSIDFLSNSKCNALFHCIAYDYSCADYDGLCDHLRGVPWDDVFKLSSINLPYGLARNTAVMSGLVLLVATWNC